MFSVKSLRTFQDAVIQTAKCKYYGENELSQPVVEAFYQVPRHQFISRFKDHTSEDWIELGPKNLTDYLDVLYGDHSLILKGTEAEFNELGGFRQLSTISQPSFVLHLLSLLDLKPGHQVFELGTGSGWNAAMISQLIGPTGHLTTFEIIPELARSAQKRLSSLGFHNVSVIEGDGGNGWSDGAPYDRVIFTAGSYDLPLAFHKQTRNLGNLLFVLQNQGGTPCFSDQYYLLRKKETHFESLYGASCAFVPLTGKYQGTASPQVQKEIEFFEEIRLRDPKLSRLKLKIYSEESIMPETSNALISKRAHSTFVWSEEM